MGVTEDHNLLVVDAASLKPLRTVVGYNDEITDIKYVRAGGGGGGGEGMSIAVATNSEQVLLLELDTRTRTHSHSPTHPTHPTPPPPRFASSNSAPCRAVCCSATQTSCSPSTPSFPPRYLALRGIPEGRPSSPRLPRMQRFGSGTRLPPPASAGAPLPLSQ